MCDLHVFVLRDYSRVFVAGMDLILDGLAREADDVEIEALAERFNIPELWEVLARRQERTAVVTPHPVTTAKPARYWVAMSACFIVAAFASLVPTLFMPMNVGVHPVAKLFCKVAFGVFLLLAGLAYWKSRGRDVA